MLGCSTWARNCRSATAAAIASASPVLRSPLSTTQRSLTLWSRARYTQPSPPCARQPSTSYCPATSSPGTSLGLKEYRVRQFGQNPSVMPGLPSRDWPTSCPQLPQNRRLSGTRGSARTAAAGSSAGTSGTSTRPAPSLPRDDRPLPGREPRVPGPLPLPALPRPVDQAPEPDPIGPDPIDPGPLGPEPLGPDPPDAAPGAAPA